MKKELIYYQTDLGKIPFEKWLGSLKDHIGKALIRTRLNRLVFGHYSDCKHLKEGIYELRIASGPGYRIYFAEIKSELIILLLIGGDKGSQSRDIEKALDYWHDFKERFSYE